MIKVEKQGGTKVTGKHGELVCFVKVREGLPALVRKAGTTEWVPLREPQKAYVPPEPLPYPTPTLKKKEV